MKDIHIREHRLKSGKKSYEYRFEAAAVDGKRKWITKSGFATKAEARRAGLLAQQQYENIGQVVIPSEMSFADYLDMWIEDDCAIDLKQITIDGYVKVIKNHIKPALGSYRLKAIKKEDLQAFILDMYDRGFSLNTLSRTIGILSKSMNYAVDHNYLLFSPAVRLKIPKNRVPKVPTRKVERDYIPADVIKAIFAKFPETTPAHIPLRLGYECGLRIGEAYAVVWEDIDLDKQILTVNRQIQWQKDSARSREDKLAANGSAACGDGYWYFEYPKYDSLRKITLSDKLTELLRREKSRQAAMREYYGEYYTQYTAEHPLSYDGRKAVNTPPVNPVRVGSGRYPVNFVCVRDNGTYITSRTMQYPSTIIRNEIYERFSFHSLRHTHASTLYEAGLNERFIMERMGHKDDRVTRAVYIHLTDQSREQGRAEVNRIFGAIEY